MNSRTLLFCIALVVNTLYLSAQTGIGTTTPVNKLQVETATANPATTGSAANGNLRLSGVSATHVLSI